MVLETPEKQDSTDGTEVPRHRSEIERSRERRQEIADRLGEEIGSYGTRLDALVARASDLPQEKREEVLAAAALEQQAALASYADRLPDGSVRGAAIETAEADMRMAFRENDIARGKNELTARRIEDASYAIGASVAGGLAGASRAVLDRAAPFLESGRHALSQATSAAAETIDKLSPSIVRAMEDFVRKVGSAGAEAGGKLLSSGAEAGGKLLSSSAEGVGKMIEKAGLGAWTVASAVLERAPATVVRGVKAMIAAFKKKE